MVEDDARVQTLMQRHRVGEPSFMEGQQRAWRHKSPEKWPVGEAGPASHLQNSSGRMEEGGLGLCPSAQVQLYLSHRGWRPVLDHALTQEHGMAGTSLLQLVGRDGAGMQGKGCSEFGPYRSAQGEGEPASPLHARKDGAGMLPRCCTDLHGDCDAPDMRSRGTQHWLGSCH